ncbi:hypothetical protein SFUMM280S_07815 [Streptomyces fumanus]
MTTTVAAYAAPSAKAPLERTTIERRALGEHDVLIDIEFAGICHSDHQAREGWARRSSRPGHEIAGVVSEVGARHDQVQGRQRRQHRRQATAAAPSR